MKKIITVILCGITLVFSGCSANGKYKRISFNEETLGENMIYISADTKVVKASKTPDIPVQLPIYEIYKRRISDDEVTETMQRLGLSERDMSIPFEVEDGNYLFGAVNDDSHGYFNMTDKELEELSWQIFRKLPFMEGMENEYEYLGIKSTTKMIDSEGEHIERAGVSFRRRLDGMRILGRDRCFLYFDGNGLVELSIELYNYKKVGAMDIVPLKSAEDRIKAPDSLGFEKTCGMIDTMQVENAAFVWVNQHKDGCRILEPLYVFEGEATDTEGNQGTFTSMIIAIPESYTNEEKYKKPTDSSNEGYIERNSQR